MTELLARTPFVCRGIIPGSTSVAIASTDEDHVDAGDKLFAIVCGGVPAFIAVVSGIRQHATHVHWSVLELDRKLPRGPLRGVTLVAEAVSE